MTGLVSDDGVEDIWVLLDAGRDLLRAGAPTAALCELDAAYDIAVEWLADADDPAALSALVRCAYWQAAAQTRNRDWGSADEKTYELLRLVIGATSGLTASDCCAVYYARGRCYLDFGAFDDALACFDAALGYDGAHPRALRDRVRACRGTGNRSAAYEYALGAVKAVPDNFDLRVELVNASIDVHSAAVAEAEARELLMMFPDRRSRGLVVLARVLAAQYRLDEALDYCAQALELDGQDPAAAELRAWLIGLAAPETATQSEVVGRKPMPEPEAGQTAKPESEAGRAVEPESAVHATEELATATDLMRSGDYTGALAAFESVAVLDPDNRHALYGQLDCLRLTQQLGEASDRARRRLDLHPDEWALRMELGLLLHAHREFGAALLCYDKVRQTRPKNPDRPLEEIEICVARSVTLCALERYVEANRDVTQLIEKHRNSSLLQEERAWIAHDEGRFRDAEYYFDQLCEEAATAYERGLAKRLPEDVLALLFAELAKARYGRGYVALTQGEYGVARSYFRQSIDAAANVSAYQLAYAWALAGSGSPADLKKAADICHEIADKAPNQLAESCLGAIYFKLDGPGDARSHLNRALDINPTASGHADLGSFHRRKGDFIAAERELSDAIRLDWDNMFAHCELGELRLAQGRFDEAEQEFRMVKAAPGLFPVAAAVGLSTCHLELDRPSDAEKELRGALKRALPGDQWRVHLALARLLTRRGQDEKNALPLYDEAHTEACEAIRLRKVEAEPHYRAGVAAVLCGSDRYRPAGRRNWYQTASNHLRDCLDRDEDRSDARRLLARLDDALAGRRRSQLVQWSLAALCGIFLAVVLDSAAEMLIQDRMPLAALFAFLAVFVVVLAFMLFGHRVQKVNISKILDLQLGPDNSVKFIDLMPKYAIGIDRLDVPPSAFWRTPGRSFPGVQAPGSREATRARVEEDSKV